MTDDLYAVADPTVAQMTDYGWINEDKHDYIRNCIVHGDTIKALMEVTDEEFTEDEVLEKYKI